MRRYFDNAIYWDSFLSILIGVILFFLKPLLKEYIKPPSISDLNSFGMSLITISATLIGFLLTIITVIVTFRNGFKDKENENANVKTSTEFPETTVFEKRKSKESIFYNTPMHKRVVDVFVYAAFEIGIVLIALLILQFSNCNFSVFWISMFSLTAFILLLLTIIRSLYIFKLFLNVHVHKEL